MAQELTFNITEDVRRLKRPTTVKDFKLSFGHADQGPTDVVIGDDGNIVQGRYGDSARQVFVNVVQGENNEPVDITGYLPEFNGCIPDAEHIVIDNWDGVLVDPRHGRFRFDFPIQAFTVAGSYKQAYFRLVQNGTGKTLATLEFDMQVLEDFVYSNIVPQDYVTPYLDMINKLKDAYTNFVGKTQDSFDQAKKRLDDIMSTVEDKADTVEQRLKIDEQALAELSKKIDDKGVFTKEEADTFKQAIQKEIDEQNTKLNSLESKVNLNALLLSGYNVRDFGALGDGENDDTDAIQKAIKQVALDWKKDNFKTNLVVMPAGRYKVTSTIILPPYVKLISSGLVTIESYLTTGATIRIKWFGEDDPNITGSGLGNAYQIQDWQRGYIIEGTNGGFSFVSKVKSDNNIGIELGFESDKERGDSNLKNIGRSGFNNISIGNYGVGLKLNNLDLFIFNFVNMHIEGNKINVQNMYVDGGSNYGENIYFDRCVIADAEIGIDQACGGYDMVFNECSLGLNKLLFSSSPWADNSISIIGGNLEGNTVIYDGSNDPVNWMTSLNIISSNIYIRKDKAADLLMFKGPLILNLDNPYIISAIEMVSPEYLCDEKVFVTYNRNPSFTRTTSSPIFITERDNVILDGNDMSKIHMNTERSKGKLVTKDDGLAQELQDAGYSSAYSYTKTSDDDNNWDNFRPVQKIDVRNRSTFFLSIFGIAHGVRANITLYISYYDNDDKLISTNKFYAGLSADQDKVLYGSTSPQHIPINAVNAALEIGVSCKDIGSSFQFGYIGMEVE
ncbi:BppU family phage baseplate upper protein [Limosilactobacillus reuteri]|uniref:BppU family phage baseplate upper protein n=1 Tax=Limosilactobacillus reuteri TaxID=1598 RepID=UPI00115C11FD|nr:BppU family phage baseplate upper protein [Limosilactobacillus reuteri]QDK48350.1 hypothetical protein DPH67_04275 [Limosilactobacillus reuteri]